MEIKINEPIINIMKTWVQSVKVDKHELLVITEEYIENLITHDIIKRNSSDHKMLLDKLGCTFTVSVDF